MKRLSIIIFIFTFLMCFIPSVRVQAKTLNDMDRELAELKAKKAENDKNKNLTQAQINKILEEIKSINAEMDKTSKAIEKAGQDIVDSEDRIAKKHDETKELIRFLQVTSGSNVYLEYLFEAENYTDFIYRYSVVNQLSEYNSNLMKELEELVRKLEQSKIDLKNKNIEFNNQKGELNKKNASLGNQLSTFKSEGTSIEEDIKDLGEQINYYKNVMKCSPNQELTSCISMPYAKGFKYPLTKGYVSSLYGWRTFYLNGVKVTDFHTGIDFAGNPEGTPVYASAPGKVARIIYRGSCGGNQVYINHLVNGTEYTTSYLHLLSINVNLYDIVSENSVVGYVGGGAGTPWDSCSTGAHLHFGFAYGRSENNFTANSFNPFNIFTKLYEGAYISSR